MVKYAKPDPDLFLTAAARLGVEILTATVVGDSVWDMLASRRARCLGIGLLSGGYGQEELERAGAYRVYEDPADMLRRIDESGGAPLGAPAHENCAAGVGLERRRENTALEGTDRQRAPGAWPSPCKRDVRSERPGCVSASMVRRISPSRIAQPIWEKPPRRTLTCDCLD
jgi:hypothetical protein